MRRSTLLISLLFALTGATLARATDGITQCSLDWVNPLPQGDRITELIWADGGYLGLASSGLVQVSDDGQSWSVVSQLLEPDNFTDLIWDGTQYLALSPGVSGATARLYASVDGLSWSSAPTGFGFLNAMATDGDRLVLVGNNSNVVYTDNLTTFNRQAFTGSWVGVVWTGTQFVAIRDEDESLTSPDGITWTLHTTGVQGKFSSLVIAGTRMVAAGFQGATMTSTDGANWTEGVSGVNSQSTVYTNGTDFILTGPLNPLVSTNGVDWSATTGTLGFALSFAASPTDYAAFSTLGRPFYSTDLSAWTDTADSFTNGTLNDVESNGEIIVAVGDIGAIFFSSNGAVWNEATQVSSSTLYDVIWDGGQFVAVGANGTFLTSPDGLDWTSTIIDGGPPLFGVTNAGSSFVAVGNQGALVSSVDGVVWVTQDSGTTNQLNAVAWSGAEYVSVGRSGTILRSTDAVSWDLVDVGTSTEFNDVVYANGQFVTVGRGGVAMTSDNGESWETQSTNAGRTLTEIKWNNGRYLASGEASLATSVDGILWELDTGFNTIATRAATELLDSAVVVGRYGTIQGGACSLFEDSFGG